MAGVRKERRRTYAVVASALAVHAALLAYSATVHSPVNGEAPAIASGVYSWTQGKFDLFRVNPPLSRMIAAIPVVLLDPKTRWDAVVDQVAGRAEYPAGQEFMRINGQRYLSFLCHARWFCMPISLLGAWLCWRWASLLYGNAAGLLALGLWCFCPNILAHGQLATADMSGAVFGALACFVFWRWLGRRTWSNGCLAGIGLGLGLLGKTTNLYLLPLFACFGAKAVFGAEQRGQRGREKRTVGQLASVLFIGCIVLHAGYGFQHALVALKSFRFASRLMAGTEVSPETRVTMGGNRFAGTWLGEIPSPVPGDYLVGIDLQVRDFELQDPSYLRGEWRAPGWWWYYLYAALVKVPAGTLFLLGVAVAGTVLRGHSVSSPKDDLFLILPAVIVLVIVSSQTGMNRHFRYVLPAFPFVFIWLSKTVATAGVGQATCRSFVAWILLSAAAVESLWIYPHSLSFFNVFVGPHNGGKHLTDSNIDWGQDFLYLRRWLTDHPSCRPLHVIDSAFYPLEFLAVGVGVDSVVRQMSDSESRLVPPFPGWYAVSVSQLYRYDKRYSHFLSGRPVGMAGYTIYIYHVTGTEANSVRRPASSAAWPATPHASSPAPATNSGGVRG